MVTKFEKLLINNIVNSIDDGYCAFYDKVKKCFVVLENNNKISSRYILLPCISYKSNDEQGECYVREFELWLKANRIPFSYDNIIVR